MPRRTAPIDPYVLGLLLGDGSFTASQAMLSTADEQIAFLGEWYPIIRERIDKRVTDPARREVLATLAERLNPSAWTDADQITTGLQQAGEALERLSRVFARRRRRGRRRPSTEPSLPPRSSEPS